MDPLLNPFDYFTLPFGDWSESALDWIVDIGRAPLLAAKAPVQVFLNLIQGGLIAVPPLVGLIFIAAVGFFLSGWRLALIGLVCLCFIGLIGAWEAAMITLSIVLTSVVLCILVGLPLGILAARSDRFFRILRPVLDFMQTMPSFVYLVPVVMLFGIGDAPGVIVTCLFAITPLIRLTNLGIREVREDMVEAAYAFGASETRVLFGTQLPLARPTILAGLNQTVLLSLTMAVVASMISVGGLGRMVLEGIGRLDFGSATVGGLGIVMAAILVDRYTQALGAARSGRGSGGA
ncbi:proline/glycine betaine ABC transporter permease [Pelagibius sp. Alg239-R121]|uniref:ABC transporter permease n=1 Tax=Pelagibius sp. Alg239-R121 TaxID=2993448 RepID=UPI0024A77C39|nr:ABC transporter permease subunit [Pelagibius sp. Alg239-R121]